MRTAVPKRRAALMAKCVASPGMSSGRSRSDGRRIGNTAIRYQRSSRKVPAATIACRSRCVAATMRPELMLAADAFERPILQDSPCQTTPSQGRMCQGGDARTGCATEAHSSSLSRCIRTPASGFASQGSATQVVSQSGKRLSHSACVMSLRCRLCRPAPEPSALWHSISQQPVPSARATEPPTIVNAPSVRPTHPRRISTSSEKRPSDLTPPTARYSDRTSRPLHGWRSGDSE